MARQVTFSDITDQRTLTESADVTVDDSPELPVVVLVCSITKLYL